MLAPPCATTSESELIAFLTAADAPSLRSEHLLALLAEDHPCYANRSTIVVERLRGYALAAVARVGVSAAILPYLLEELESGETAYLVAAAARGLRGAPAPPPQSVPHLVAALARIRYKDDALSTGVFALPPPAGGYTTALAEIAQTLGRWPEAAPLALAPLRELLASPALPAVSRQAIEAAVNHLAAAPAASPSAADCCATPGAGAGWRFGNRPRSLAPLADELLEDQDGRQLRFGDFFTGKPAVIVFFYSRCPNPAKCSLTITRLSQLQQALDEAGLSHQVRLAAFTYDPLYDHPARLREFGLRRWIRFTDDVRFFRTPHGLDSLRHTLGLGVNFFQSLVNRHRIELYLTNATGQVVATATQLQWQVADVTHQLRDLLNPPPVVERAGPASPAGRLLRGTLSALSPLAIALFPKCPICWAAYAGAFGVGGIKALPYSPWLQTILFAFVALHLVAVGRRSRRNRYVLPFACSLAGVGALVAGSLGTGPPLLSLLGVGLISVGAFLNSAAPVRRPYQFG